MKHIEETIRESGIPGIGLQRCTCDSSCKKIRLFMINPRIDDEGTFYVVIDDDMLSGVIRMLELVRDDR